MKQQGNTNLVHLVAEPLLAYELIMCITIQKVTPFVLNDILVMVTNKDYYLT